MMSRLFFVLKTQWTRLEIIARGIGRMDLVAISRSVMCAAQCRCDVVMLGLNSWPSVSSPRDSGTLLNLPSAEALGSSYTSRFARLRERSIREAFPALKRWAFS